MKKLLPALLAVLCLHACSKSDKPAEPVKPEDQWLVTKTKSSDDSLILQYNDAGQLVRFTEYFGLYADSTEVAYADNKLSKFLLLLTGEKRTDRTFIYEGINLVKVNYYNDVPGGWGIVDTDSLVYKDGKLVAFYEIFGGVKSTVYKLKWEKDNVDTVMASYLNGDIEIPFEYTTYAYNDKPGYNHGFKTGFPAIYDKYNFSYLSANGLVKEERKATGTDAIFYTNTVVLSYNERNQIITYNETKDDKENSVVTTRVTTLEYAKF